VDYECCLFHKNAENEYSEQTELIVNLTVPSAEYSNTRLLQSITVVVVVVVAVYLMSTLSPLQVEEIF